MPYRLTAEEFEALPVSEIQRERREAIRNVEARLLATNLEGTGHELVTDKHPLAQPHNVLTKGIYTRTVFLPAGLRVTGKRHSQEHINIVACGRATVMTEFGREEVVGPCQFVSPAGTKRFLHVHEDMVWTVVSRTDETDMAAIEADLIIAEPLPALEA